MFYDIICQLCQEKGVAFTRLLDDLEMSKGNLSRWKAGIVPKSDTLKKIANYFDVPVDHLLGEESQRDEPIIIHRLRKITDKMDENQQRKMMNIIKASFEELFDDDSSDSK